MHDRSVALFASHGIPVEFVPWAPRRNLLGALRHMVGILREAGPCLLHAHDVRSDFVALLAGRFAQTPVVVSNHAWHAQGLKRRIQEGLRARWLPFADLVVSVSEDTHRETVRRGVPAERSVALYSGLDLEPYRTLPPRDVARARLGIPADIPVISNVARMWPEKALAALVEAAARLLPRYPGLRVLQVGDGPLMDELKAAAARRGIERCVTFLGFRSDYAEVMRASDVFALPSLAEGMPMVIYSAMALGLPIVASDVNGMRDTLEHDRTALIMRPGNVDDLTASLDRLLSDRDLAERLGGAAKHVMERRFSAEQAVRKLEALYDAVLERRGARHGRRQTV